VSIPTPITPGDLLAAEFLAPMGITQYRLAKEIRVPAQRMSEIVAGKRAIPSRWRSASTASRERVSSASYSGAPTKDANIPSCGSGAP
jgi:hypothetical protein